MRRVASSLGMRRSSSFFWTPGAHRDFEAAIGALNARGAEVSAIAIMQHMGHHADLKPSDVERHLQKKQLVQQRILQQLQQGQSLSPLELVAPAVAAPPRAPTSPGGLVRVAEEPAALAGGGLPPASVPSAARAFL